MYIHAKGGIIWLDVWLEAQIFQIAEAKTRQIKLQEAYKTTEHDWDHRNNQVSAKAGKEMST